MANPGDCLNSALAMQVVIAVRSNYSYECLKLRDKRSLKLAHDLSNRSKVSTVGTKLLCGLGGFRWMRQ